MKYSELIANSNIAFGSGRYKEALKYAENAITSDPKSVDGYSCAGKACMSLDMPQEAIKYFEKAVSIEDRNGNLYFLLGYAQALSNNTAGALKSLTKSLESNCDLSLKGQIYKMISMINSEQGDYKNALINLEQAENILGIDFELLEEKASCYANLKDYHQTLYTLNQMKLLQPSDYRSYSLAFNIFMELNIFDEACSELERARKYADLNILYYYDWIAYTLFHDTNENSEDPEKWVQVLHIIDEGLKKGHPIAEQVFELYLRAAQLYLSLENPEMAIKVLDAAVDPVYSYNNGFSILAKDITADEPSDLNRDDISAEDEEEIMQEKWDNGEFDDIREDIENALLDSDTEDPDELSEEIHQYLTPTDVIPSTEAEKTEYVLVGEFNMDQAQADMRNSMYIAAYELLKDYDKMLQKAMELQASSIVVNQYSGIYYELKVGKHTQKENWEKKYKERINFWTKRMLEDPTDFISASYRIRSYIDIGDYKNAEQLCACLPTDVKVPLMEEINKAKAQGGGEDGNSH